eukprot:TRINITY_DN11318_c0_g1_i1.p1 TRINITY_DN11318_c0_g1~~TRINITY_DN11318_c0_g1_i1.p1  ORF type:complete len:557 (+),score=148.59 TRINITY_DN11318_c0_g1_i1:60-1673(+)
MTNDISLSTVNVPQNGEENTLNENGENCRNRESIEGEKEIPKEFKEEISIDVAKIVGTGKILTNPRYNFRKNGRRTLGQFFFAGRISRYLLWPTSIIIAFAYLVIIFGLFPLGKPLPGDETRTTLGNTWVLLALVNPINSCVIGYLHYVVFLCCMGVERPFKVHPVILIIIFVIQILVWGPSISRHGFFDLFGLAAIGLTLLIAYLSMYGYERLSIRFRDGADDSEKMNLAISLKKNYLIFLKIGAAVLIFLFILVTFIFGFEYLGDSPATQKILPFAMAIIVFIVRKTMLGLMDPFPHEIAMFVSGFWVENMYDMFQSIAYPSVKDPTTYIAVWVANFFSVIANLVFLTTPWFKFRIWIKAVLIALFKCKPVCHPNVEPEMEDIDDERGHSNNLPGYHRRQIRFYFLKVLSKMVGCIFYLSTSAILRYGPNSAIYPFSTLTTRQYEYSVAFSAGNFAFFFLAGLVGYLYIRKSHRDLFQKMSGVIRLVVKDRAYVGLCVTVLVHNGILALYMLMYFNRIWYSFNIHRYGSSTIGTG